MKKNINILILLVGFMLTFGCNIETVETKKKKQEEVWNQELEINYPVKISILKHYMKNRHSKGFFDYMMLGLTEKLFCLHFFYKGKYTGYTPEEYIQGADSLLLSSIHRKKGWKIHSVLFSQAAKGELNAFWHSDEPIDTTKYMQYAVSLLKEGLYKKPSDWGKIEKHLRKLGVEDEKLIPLDSKSKKDLLIENKK